MKNIVFTNENGLVVSKSKVVNHSYTTGQYMNGLLFHDIDDTLFENINKYRYANNEWLLLPEKPTDSLFYLFDGVNNEWVFDATTAKNNADNKLDGNLYNFIVKVSKFPEWKQAEYADTYSELSIKKLTNGISVEEQTTIDNIVLVRAWKNQLKSNNATASKGIQNATTIADINTAVSTMTYTTPPFQI